MPQGAPTTQSERSRYSLYATSTIDSSSTVLVSLEYLGGDPVEAIRDQIFQEIVDLFGHSDAFSINGADKSADTMWRFTPTPTGE